MQDLLRCGRQYSAKIIKGHNIEILWIPRLSGSRIGVRDDRRGCGRGSNVGEVASDCAKVTRIHYTATFIHKCCHVHCHVIPHVDAGTIRTHITFYPLQCCSLWIPRLSGFSIKVRDLLRCGSQYAANIIK